MNSHSSAYLKNSGVRFLFLVFCLNFSIAEHAILYAESEYSAHDLGDFTIAWGVNNSGVVVGTKFNETFPNLSRAFSYSNGVITDLGTLGGSNGIAYGINDAGTIVGQSDLTNGTRHAFRYSNGVMTDLGTLGGSNSVAYAINNAGIIVGRSDLANGTYHAFSYSNGVMVDIGTPGGYHWSVARAINNAGVIVGESAIYDPFITTIGTRAFSYSNGVMTNLGSLSGESHAYGVNDVGEIVGYSLNAAGSAYDAFLTIGTNINDLGAHTYAYGVNGSGAVVGVSAPTGYSHASRYTGGVWADLYSCVTNIGITRDSFAYGINDAGSIVGYGITAAQNVRGFLLIRVTPTIILSPPFLSNATVRVSFSVSSGSAESFTLLDASQPAGPWNANLGALLSTNVSGSYNFVTPLTGDSARFYRVRSP